MENEIFYEGVPANMMLSIKNDGTCAIYKASLTANWTDGSTIANVNDLYAGDSKKIPLFFSNLDSGTYQLVTHFTSLNYNMDKQFEYYVKAVPKLPQTITDPKNNFSNNDTENITNETQKVELDANDSEEDSILLEESKANPYLVYIVTAIVLIVAGFALKKREYVAPKNTFNANVLQTRKKQNLPAKMHVAKKDDLSDIQIRLAEIKRKLNE